jgi:hypothetical protein
MTAFHSVEVGTLSFKNDVVKVLRPVPEGPILIEAGRRYRGHPTLGVSLELVKPN